MIKNILVLLGILAGVAVVFWLATPAQAGERTFSDVLNDKGINHMMTPSQVYILDDTDPRTICEMADNFPRAGVREVQNVKTLKHAKCGIVVR